MGKKKIEKKVIIKKLFFYNSIPLGEFNAFSAHIVNINGNPVKIHISGNNEDGFFNCYGFVPKDILDIVIKQVTSEFEHLPRGTIFPTLVLYS